MTLSRSTVERLRRAGWTPARSANVDAIVDDLVTSGYEVSAVVIAFLRSFASLALSYPNFRDPTQPDGCHFDVIRASKNVHRATIDAWAERLGTQLLPIGEAFDEHMTLVMTEDGRVFGGYDDFLAFIGQDGEDAIEALCSGREIQEVTA